MRHDDQALDLLVAGIGEREHRPVGVALAGAHVDAADDAVGAGRGRDQDAAVLAAMAFDRVGEIDRGRVEPHIDGLDRVRGRDADQETASIAIRQTARTKPNRRPPGSTPVDPSR